MIPLSGCGNTASSVSSQSEADNSISSDPVLQSVDIEGYWIIQNSGGTSLDAMLKLGMLNVLQFEDNDKFKIIMRLADATLEREGTYRISGDKVFISVPEMEKQSNGALSISAKAIEDAEVEIDGDILTTTAISTDGSKLTAKKSSDDQYEKYIEQIAAMAPKKVAVGETIATNTATFTVNSLAYVDEVYPSDTSGYYTYLEHQDGKTYLLTNITFTNEGTEYAVPGYSTTATFNVAGNKYSGQIEVDAGSHFGKSYNVEAKDTATLYIYCAVPDSVKDAGSVPKVGVAA